tara:strand:- start:44 stop:520 length:477 start_codon:yes stop_codon:yes gene_type:complete
MIEVKITETHLESAKTLAENLGQLKNSITGGDGNLAGFIGEVVVSEITGSSHSNTYDYDLILPSGKTVDVKTKRTNYAPRENYDCSVAAFNTKQKCDYYAFVRVKNDLSVAWILGFYEKSLYFQDAKLHKRGDYDPDNRFTFKADCYNIKISNLVGCP